MGVAPLPTVAAASNADGPLRPLLTCRPDIEGLRAVAVGLVVVLHVGVAAVSGGYVGVDVFFVISGFLITSLLIDEVRGTKRVSILGFYARRARRILPAACFVIAVTVAATYSQLGALVGRTTAIDGQWAAGFAANFRFIRQGTDYFASTLPPSPLQHFWSLAVEEQFYLVWPSVLFGLVVAGRRFATRSTLIVQGGLVAIVVGSLCWSIHLSRINPTNAYFSPLTRAWELGAGALIAIFSIPVARTNARLRSSATWIGVVLIGIAAFAFSASTVFPGYAALLPVAGTVLVVAGGIGQPNGSAGSILGLAPMRWLGRISFSLYLWHWPVIVIAEERSRTPLSTVARIACVLITLALSVTTYYMIERPLRSSPMLRPRSARTSWERSRKALAVGAFSILVAVSVSLYTNNRAVFAIDRAARVSLVAPKGLSVSSSLSVKEKLTALQQKVQLLVRHGLTLTSVPDGVDPPVLQMRMDPKYSPCLQERSETTVKPCTFGDRTGRQALVVFGDSHAMMWMPALDTYAEQVGYRLVTVQKRACPIPAVKIVSQQGPYAQCDTWRKNALEYIRVANPAAVVVAFAREGVDFDLSVWLRGLQTTVRTLRSESAHVVEISNTPLLPQDPSLCLSRPNADPSACTGDYSYRHGADPERAVVSAAGATYIDAEPWFCFNGRCPVIIDNRIAYRDHDHLEPQYVEDLEPLLAAELTSTGMR
jgi:peptidoglycan/LPS O-acetylase OafA/YrhL